MPGDLGRGQRLRGRLGARVVVRVVEERVRQLVVPEQRVVPAHPEEVDHPVQRGVRVADQVLVPQLQVAAGRRDGRRPLHHGEPAGGGLRGHRDRVGPVALDDDPTGPVPAPRPSGHLGQELERPLRRAEVGQ